MSSIPIVNLKSIENRLIEEDHVCKPLAEKIRDALGSCGFMYLVNHGIPEEVISRLTAQSKDFFNLPKETKMKYLKNTDKTKAFDLDNHFGYMPPGGEQLKFDDNIVEYEAKELFDCVQDNSNVIYPNAELPNFQSTIQDFNLECKALTKKLLQLVAISLEVNINFFVDACPHLENPDKHKGMDVVRLLHYPALHNTCDAKPGAVRCGEHSDYLFLSFLFQDDVGGLEVKTLNGDWIHAKPIPGSIVVNTGDLTEFWTRGIFPATPHKIVLPGVDDVRQLQSRYSIVYFTGPGVNTIITPLDMEKRAVEENRLAQNGRKYTKEPVIALDYLMGQIARMNGYTEKT